MAQVSTEGYPCLECGGKLYPTGKKGNTRKRCIPCVADVKRRRERDAARVKSAAARSARPEVMPSAVACRHCGTICDIGRLTCDTCRNLRKKQADADRHRRDYPTIQAGRPPEIHTCVDCDGNWQRESVKGPKPRRCPLCLALWKTDLRRQQRLNNPEPTRMRIDLRRAKVWGVGSERFHRREIFERDGWMCQLCFEPVDREVAWPHPRSASLDHIIPVSKGGPHTRANTRCTHLRCNLSRNNRISDADLELLGMTWEQVEQLQHTPVAA